MSKAAVPSARLTSSDVRWAYRILLDRECESDEVVNEKVERLGDKRALRMELLTSDEYYENITNHREQVQRKPCVVIKKLGQVCSNGVRIHLDLSDYISTEIAHNNYDVQEVQFIKRIVKTGDTVLDLGAHVGYYTLILASIVGENGKVFSFEPQEHLFSLLQQSIQDNGYQGWIIAENCCVGDVTRKGRLAQHHGPGDYGCTHLLATPSSLPLYDDLAIEETNILNLADCNFPRAIDFIKIDVEGAEYLALKPFEKRLKQDQPIILSEVNKPLLAHVSSASSAEYIELVKSCGYNCFCFDDDESINDISNDVQNVVFIPEGKQLPDDVLFAGGAK